jgi:hypothetical protein
MCSGGFVLRKGVYENNRPRTRRRIAEEAAAASSNSSGQMRSEALSPG